MADAAIVRNRAKIEAAIANARAAASTCEPGRADLVLRARRRGRRARGRGRGPGRSRPSRRRWPRSSRARLQFVGPTTAYALMQACGLVDDHIAGCS